MSEPMFHLHRGEGEVHSVLGVDHRIVFAGEQTDGAAAVVEITVAPGTGSPPHSDSREDLVWYVTDGVIDFEIDDTSLQLEAGGAVFMKRNSRHRSGNSGDRPARGLMLALPAGIEGFLRDAASTLPAGMSVEPPPPEALQTFAQVAGSLRGRPSRGGESCVDRVLLEPTQRPAILRRKQSPIDPDFSEGFGRE